MKNWRLLINLRHRFIPVFLFICDAIYSFIIYSVDFLFTISLAMSHDFKLNTMQGTLPPKERPFRYALGSFGLTQSLPSASNTTIARDLFLPGAFPSPGPLISKYFRVFVSIVAVISSGLLSFSTDSHAAPGQRNLEEHMTQEQRDAQQSRTRKGKRRRLQVRNSDVFDKFLRSLMRAAIDF